MAADSSPADCFNVNIPDAAMVLQNKVLRRENEHLRDEDAILKAEILIQLKLLCEILGIHRDEWWP